MYTLYVTGSFNTYSGIKSIVSKFCKSNASKLKLCDFVTILSRLGYFSGNATKGCLSLES